MSYNVTGTTITLTRGDTFEALVSATSKDGIQYVPCEGDTLRFALKENYSDAAPLIVKDIPVEAMISALGIEEYAKTADVNAALANKVDKVEGSRLMTNVEGTKLAGIAEGAQVNVIEKIKVNGVEQTVTDKSVDIKVPTGALADLDEVAEENLSSALKEKVNAAAEGNHSHANKTVLDGITAEKVAAWDAAEQNAKDYVDGLVATTDEVTAMCTEVFGA